MMGWLINYEEYASDRDSAWLEGRGELKTSVKINLKKLAMFWGIRTYHLLARWFLERLIFDTEDGGDNFLRNADS
jgi:capsid portal protein